MGVRPKRMLDWIQWPNLQYQLGEPWKPRSLIFINKRKLSMAHKQELRKQILQLLQVMSEGQNIIQCIKEALVMHEEFSPIVLFETISNGKQRCTKGDIAKFLEKHSIQFSTQQLREYMRENRLGKETSFHEFIDSIMPFNADALRVYKETYLEKLAIRQQDAEVELIFRQLLENQFKFIRSIDMIKNEILLSCRNEISKVNQLIKSDLVGKSKVREGKKFEEKFDNPNNEISFIDLRRFLELHIPTHEVVLLNLMRKLRTQNPLKPINLRLEHGLRQMSRSKSKNRSKERSTKKSKTNLRTTNDDYEDFKKQLQKEYEAQQQQPKSRPNKSKSKSKKQLQTRWERQKKNTNGNLIKKLLQTIISKEQLLQKQRKKLFQCKDFNMINLFKLMDTNNNGALSQDDIVRFVSKFSSSTKISYKPLFEAFAKQQGLRFHQLYTILQPLSKELVKTITNKQEDVLPNPFKEKTIALIVEILLSTVEALREINRIKQQINDSGQDINELFSYIDVKGKNYITAEDIKQLLEEDQFFTDHKDMKLLFKHLSKKADQKIELLDFRRLVEL